MIAIQEVSTEQAWHALHDPLLGFLRKHVVHEDIAQDLLQEVFLKVHTSIHTLKNSEKLEQWVYQIARNQLIDYYRREKSTVSLEDVERYLPIDEIPDEDMNAQLAASLITLLKCLPKSYQEALWLTEYRGLTQKELAKYLGISISGAKSRVQRAREKLKQVLLDCCHIEFDHLGHVINYQARCSCCEQRGCSNCQTTC
jgi:RNA polymerase sigma-70 factor (ECF subfamily)